MMPALNILVVDDEVTIRKTLSVCLETEGHKVLAVSNFQDALTETARWSFELALVDLRLGTENGLDLIPALLAQTPWLKIIVITAYASIDTAVEAMRRGATDYLPKPFTPAQVKLAVQKVIEMRALEQRVAALQEDLGRSHPETEFSSTIPGDATGHQSGPPGGPVRSHHPYARRKRNRQDRSGPSHSFLEQAGGQTAGHYFLSFFFRGIAGERTLRACQGGFYRGRSGQPGPDGRLRGRHPLSRRDR